MTCDDVRAALSARLDGEDPQAAPAELDAHLGGCSGCRAWLARAEEVTRLAGTSAVDIANSTTALVHEVGHLAAAVQAGLLRALVRVGGDPQRPLTATLAPGRG
ncbi:zf-HC2 domain-containing protein [Micromonospora costi]|uniref:zf-HC2 domain-containing protein n=1 Tax=Micromonospora costi TaxID=1530042 RepID=UPI0033E2354A